MFKTINEQFNAAKRNRREFDFILESTFGVTEVLPGSEEDIDSIIDVDSVPEDAYQKIDAMLDKIVSAENYDDVEASELVDGDDDIDDIDSNELDAIIDEAAREWLMVG